MRLWASLRRCSPARDTLRRLRHGDRPSGCQQAHCAILRSQDDPDRSAGEIATEVARCGCGSSMAAPRASHSRCHEVVLSVAFSPKGDRIVSGGARWHGAAVAAGRHAPRARHSRAMRVRSGASRSRPRATGSSRAGTMARCGCGSLMAAPRGSHSKAMRLGPCAFLAQGDRIVSGGDDGTVRAVAAWMAAPRGSHSKAIGSGHERRVLAQGRPDRLGRGRWHGALWQLDGRPAAEPFEGLMTVCVWSVAFSPQGDRIVSGGDDGTVRLWQLNAHAPDG